MRNRRLVAALAGLAAGLARGVSIPAVSDEFFHLLRAGTPLLHGSFRGYSVPPGGEHAPLLGAWATALGETISRGISGALPSTGPTMLAASAALLAWALIPRGAPAAAFGVALFLLPPAFVNSAIAHPDSALAGALLLAATIAGSARPATAGALGAAASLASPVALPALAALTLSAPRSRRNAVLLPAALAAFAILVLSIGLPAGSRGEIARGLFAGWGTPAVNAAAALASWLRSWGEGLVLLGAFGAAGLALRSSSENERRILLVGVSCMGGTLLFGSPLETRTFMPALAPLGTLIAALLVSRIPDPGSGPARRPILLAMCIPLGIFLARTSAERSKVNDERARCDRMAQIAELLPALVPGLAPPISSRTGSLAFHAKRPVLSLDTLRGEDLVAALDSHSPIFFEKALLPARPNELAVFRNPETLRLFAPRVFRRGAHGEIEDAFWMPRDAAVLGTPAPPAYRIELARGWEAHARGRIDAAARAFAAACAAEPEGLGIAREWSGMQEGALGRMDEARARFEEAAARDPATARARGYLADIAISRGDRARAHTLLGEAMAWSDDDAEIWGTSARLAAAEGDSAKARQDLERAIHIAPGLARLRLNAGSLLWGNGALERAKQEWGIALQISPELARYLGDFRRAKPGDPPPPLIPLFTMDSFEAGAPPQP